MKDFILIGGGILIALVVGHGFWIAWRAKREPLRMDIVPDLIPDDVDEMERLRGELPNGGARVVKGGSASATDQAGQQNLELDLAAPTLTEAAALTDATAQSSVSQSAPASKEAAANGALNDTVDTARKALFDRPKKLRARVHQTAATPRTEGVDAPAAMDAADTTQGVQQDIEQDTEQAIERDPQPTPSVGAVEPLVSQRPNVREVELQPQGLHSEPRKPSAKTQGFKNQALKRQMQKQREKERELQREQNREQKNERRVEKPSDNAPVVEELLIINVLAPKGQRFDGEGLVAALRSQGLRYGDMNIFHRIDPATKAKLYSVANAIEPGTFDLSDLNAMRSPGMTFFLQLPGPDDASTMFDDMLQAARNVALDLGGELRDEDLSVLTGQTTEHMRQRIADFARRRLSKRA